MINNAFTLVARFIWYMLLEVANEISFAEVEAINSSALKAYWDLK